MDLDVDPSFVELLDPSTRADVRPALEERIAFARGHWLVNQSISADDRPGAAPEWLAEVHRSNLADVMAVDDSTPGCFVLPLAPQRRTGTALQAWIRQCSMVFAKRIRDAEWRRARFQGSIALDIALRGSAATFKDIDNRAWDVVKAFEAGFSQVEPQLDGYRVYRLPYAPSNDIRVRLLPATRLRWLANALAHSRAFVQENRRERSSILARPPIEWASFMVQI